MKQQILAAAMFVAATGPAAAYTSYILADDFTPEGASVTLQAAFARTFFTPEIGLPADMRLIFPDGSEGSFARVAVSGAATALDASLLQHGTYRVTTGERRGPVATLVAHEGGWRQLGDGEIPPEDAETTTLRTVTVADAYVSRGAPTRAAVDSPIGALAIHPITHPNEVLLSQGFQVELLFNGAPFPNMPLVLYEAGDADTNLETYFVTDAAGRATLTFPQTGNYVIAVRHRANAPAGADAEVYSYTTTLTFNVINAIPNYPPPPTHEAERPRRRGLERY